MAPPDYYEGPVCFGLDGWHYTVVEDTEAREYALTISQATLDFKSKRGNETDIALAQAELDEVKARSFDAPGERLHFEDTEDGSEFRFRLATDEDTRSHHDRKSKRIVGIEWGMTTEELEAALAERKRVEGGQ